MGICPFALEPVCFGVTSVIPRWNLPIDSLWSPRVRRGGSSFYGSGPACGTTVAPARRRLDAGQRAETVAHKPANASEGSWTNLFPMLNGVSAVSDTEAWAAGDYGHIVHYSGGSWSALDPP